MSQVAKVGQLEIVTFVDGARQGGLGLFEIKVPAGARVPPPHSHTDNEECVYVLDGVLRYAVDGTTRDLTPSEWVSTPRGSVHHFSNSGSETARALVMMTPDIGEQYFHEVAALTGAGGPPDRTKLMEVMARYGLVPMAQNPAAGPSGANQFPEYYGGVDPSPASTDALTNEQTSTHSNWICWRLKA